MTRQEILELVRKNPTSFMATVDNGQPRVRAMETPLITDEGLTFCTGTHKPVCQQLRQNPDVELAYWSDDEGIMVRLRGAMEDIDSEELKKTIVETKFTFLKPVVDQVGYEALAVFRLTGGTYKLWDRNQGGRESTGTF